MSSKLLFNSAKIKIPDEMAIFTKNGKIKMVKPLKNNTIKTINKKKAIIITEDKDVDNIVIESQGRKIELDDINNLDIKKMYKEKKPRSKTTSKPKKTRKTKSINLPEINIPDYIKNWDYEKEMNKINQIKKKQPEIKNEEVKQTKINKENLDEYIEYIETEQIDPKIPIYMYRFKETKILIYLDTPPNKLTKKIIEKKLYDEIIDLQQEIPRNKNILDKEQKETMKEVLRLGLEYKKISKKEPPYDIQIRQIPFEKESKTNIDDFNKYYKKPEDKKQPEIKKEEKKQEEIKPIEINDKKKEVYDFIDNINKYFISNRKEMFKTETQKKYFRKLVESQEFDDFYQTPQETSKYIYDEIKRLYKNEPITILDPCCGLLSLSKNFIEDKETKYKMYLNDISRDFYEIIKPLESNDVIINNYNFLLEFKKYFDKNIDVIVCNPPFKLFIEVKEDDYKDYQYGYILFIYAMYKVMINNKRYSYPNECFYVLPKTLIKNNQLIIPKETRKTVLGYFLRKKLITDEEYENDLEDDWYYGIHFIKDVTDFKKLSRGKPVKLGLTCGLYQFFY